MRRARRVQHAAPPRPAGPAASLRGGWARRAGGLWTLGVLFGSLAAPVHAQRLSVGAGAFNAQRRIYLQTAVQEQTGVLVGGSGTVRAGRAGLAVSGWIGTLKGDGSAANPDVKARTTAAVAQVLLAPGVRAGVQYEVRRVEAGSVVSVWKMMGVNARLEPGFGVPGLAGLVDVSTLPASSTSGGPKITMAVQVTLGVAYEPRRGPLSFRLGYRFERFDFEAAGSAGARYEQFGGLAAEVGVRVGGR